MRLPDQLKETPSQTAGPYVHIGCFPRMCGIEVFDHEFGAEMVSDATKGERIEIRGTVFDGTGAPLRDALIEIWQADADGLHPGHGELRGEADPAFAGFGRSAGDPDTGEFVFRTIKPGRVPFKTGALMAPHITFWIAARGINVGLHTRMYFPDEEAANADDPVLARIELKSRIPTLIARPEGPGVYRFDIRLQGEGETVFFDI